MSAVALLDMRPRLLFERNFCTLISRRSCMVPATRMRLDSASRLDEDIDDCSGHERPGADGNEQHRG